MAQHSHPRPVLLIDDSHEDLFLMKRLLSRTGVKHPIVTIDDGEEAVAFLRACSTSEPNGLLPLVIFCDVKMPGKDGFEVLKWIRSTKVLDHVPVHILSGANLERDRDRALELGATGYLEKFPTPETLGALLKSAEQSRP